MPPKKTRTPKRPAPRARATRTAPRARATRKIWGLKPTKKFITNQLVLFYDGENTQYGRIVSQVGGTYTINSIAKGTQYTNIPPSRIAGKNSLPSFFAVITPAEQTLADGCQQTCPIIQKSTEARPRINLDRQPIINMLNALICTKPGAADGSCPLKKCEEGDISNYNITFECDLIKPVSEENTYIAEYPFSKLKRSGNDCCIRINVHDDTPDIQLIQQCDVENYHRVQDSILDPTRSSDDYITTSDIQSVYLYNKHNNIIAINKKGSIQQYKFYHCYKASRGSTVIYILLTYIPMSVLCRIKNTYKTELIGRTAPKLRDTDGIPFTPEESDDDADIVKGFDQEDIDSFKQIFCKGIARWENIDTGMDDIESRIASMNISQPTSLPPDEDEDEGEGMSMGVGEDEGEGMKFNTDDHTVRGLSSDAPYMFEYY